MCDPFYENVALEVLQTCSRMRMTILYVGGGGKGFGIIEGNVDRLREEREGVEKKGKDGKMEG